MQMEQLSVLLYMNVEESMGRENSLRINVIMLIVRLLLTYFSYPKITATRK